MRTTERNKPVIPYTAEHHTNQHGTSELRLIGRQCVEVVLLLRDTVFDVVFNL